MNRKGFIGIAVLVLIAAASVAFAGYEYYQAHQSKLGATVYTTQLTDTLNTFRQEVNSSTANLNTDLMAAQATIGTYGTIVTQNTPLPIVAGGTATTTAPSDSQFLSANGSTPTWKNFVNGAGITVSSTATSTHFNTVGFDSSVNIAFTGNNTFAGSSTFNGYTNLASTTINGNAILSTTTINGNLTVNGFVSSTYVGGRQIFIASGTFTAPAGVTLVLVTEVGGGGGGGGVAIVANNANAGGGGTGGFYIKYPYSVTPLSAYTVTVGSAGTGGAAGNNNGNNGANTVFDGLTATGGGGGAACNTNGCAGGGGSAGSPNGTAGMAAAAGSHGGAGGSSIFGQGGGGGVNATGGGGSPVGSGGGGGGTTSGGVAFGGGNGANGYVIVEW